MSINIKQIAADNYFSLLGLPVSFEIDNNSLNSNYHELQKSIHPDNYANASDAQRRLSVQKAAQINDALQTLKNPLRRAIYLLSLYGVELGENDTAMEPAFLMEQMELREGLAQVNDKDDPLGALDVILDDVKLRISQAIEQLRRLFAELLAAKAQDDELQPQLSATKTQVLKLQFLNRLQEECLNKEEDLMDQF